MCHPPAFLLEKRKEGTMFLNTDFLRTDEIFLKLDHTVDPSQAGRADWLPAYHFSICLPDGAEAGVCDLRIGHNESVYYGGNIGYRVYPEHRGRHYAGKACLLLFELARRHGLEYLYITCNPENAASRKTCEFAGGALEDIVSLPPDNDMYLEGERCKCIYKFSLLLP